MSGSSKRDRHTSSPPSDDNHKGKRARHDDNRAKPSSVSLPIRSDSSVASSLADLRGVLLAIRSKESGSSASSNFAESEHSLPLGQPEDDRNDRPNKYSLNHVSKEVADTIGAQINFPSEEFKL
jgi:hypothetical protein